MALPKVFYPMKKLKFEPSPEVCSSMIEVELDNRGLIAQVKFLGGCPGNLEGMSRLLVGLTPEKAIEMLRGIRCGAKSTSCPDQLALALEQMIKK